MRKGEKSNFSFVFASVIFPGIQVPLFLNQILFPTLFWNGGGVGFRVNYQ